MSNQYGPQDIHFLSVASIMLAIQGRFDGGLDQFKEDGGLISIVPGAPMTMFIYHPTFPEALRKELEAAEGQLGVSFRFVNTLNFEGMELDEIKENMYTLGQQMLQHGDATINMNAVVAILQLWDLRPKKELVEAAKALLKNLPGLVRGCICYSNKTEWVENDVPGHIKLEEPTREMAIKDEDITNLKIALETDPWKLFE